MLSKSRNRANPKSVMELYHLFVGKPQCAPVDESYVSDKHVHKEVEIAYVVRGELEVMVDQHLYTVQEGEMLNIPGYSLHQYQPKKAQAEVVKVKFMKEWLILPFLDTPQKEGINELYGAVFLAKVDDALKKIMQKMRQCSSSSNEDMYCYSKIVEATSYMLEHPELIKLNMQVEAISHRYMEQAISYMQEHCPEKLTLKMLADHLGLTETYCSKYIKKNTGITFVEYLNVLRVNRAQRLLWATDFCVSEIAELVGFSSVQTFNRVFKQQTRGMSPTEYRKINKKKTIQ